jgi:hypothetical protein
VVDNQHQKITGYRDLSENEIELINRIKEVGGDLMDLIIDLGVPTYDQRWVNIGKTQLQQGIMALVRSVAQPTGF